MTVGRAINCTSLCNTARQPDREAPRFREFPGAQHDPRLRRRRGTGRPGARGAVQFIEGSRFEQLRDGSVGVAFLCGLPYVRLCAQRPGMLQPLAAPILDEARYQDRPVYFSDVIVHRDSPFLSFEDLRGRSWAYNDPDSFSGWLLVRHYLVQMGETEAFFGRLAFSGWHQESIRRVHAGEIDASAIDSQVLGVE